MRLIIFSIMLTVVAGLLAACNSKDNLSEIVKATTQQPQVAPPPSPPPSDGAPRISAEDLHNLWEKGKVFIIDTRSEQAYEESHIKGSQSMPVNEVADRIKELPRDKMIVAYCT